MNEPMRFHGHDPGETLAGTPQITIRNGFLTGRARHGWVPFIPLCNYEDAH